MDPATAFQLVCGAMQLLQFGFDTVKAFHDIAKSPEALTSDFVHLEYETNALGASCAQISKRLSMLSQAQLSPEQAHLKSVAQDCEQTAVTLKAQIDKLKLTGPHSKLKLPIQWARLMLEKERIKRIQAQLQRCQQRLDTQMHVDLCRNLDVNVERHWNLLEGINLREVQNSDVLKQMHSDLRSIVDATANQVLNGITNEGEKTRQLMSDLALEENYRANQQRLLQSLGFPTMNTRQEEIHDAYPETFEWIMDQNSSFNLSKYKFLAWLETDQEIFWIYGKPGSGKSTLVNFLVHHSGFKNALHKWAGDKQLIMPTFFFWRAGRPEQRSINGLLRSLLHRIFSEYPKLVQTIDVFTKPVVHEWTNKRLIEALQTVLENVESRPIKVCLVIDGLDEFQDPEFRQSQLVSFIQELVRNTHIKAVLSSRPDQCFIDRLAMHPSLRLQDLTYKDICTYVEHRLFDEPLTREYKDTEDQYRLQALVEKVSHKAEGVFLWARLALQDLLSGIEERDPLEVLERRLDHLDNSLDSIFAQLLERVPAVHLRTAARYLLFEKAWSSSRVAELTTLDFAFACDTKLSSDLDQLISIGEHTVLHRQLVDCCIKKIQHLSSWLRTRTAGLLDVYTVNVLPHRRIGMTNLSENELSPIKPNPGSLAQFCFNAQNFTRVRIIHRSAWEFLDQNEQGIEFLRQAEISFAEKQQMLDDVCAAVANMSLFIFHDHVALMASPQLHNVRPTNIGHGSVMIPRIAFRSFINNVRLIARRLDHHTRIYVSIQIAYQKLERYRLRIFDSLARLVQSLRDNRISLEELESINNDVDHTLLYFPRCLSEEGLWLWLMIRSDQVLYVTQRMDLVEDCPLRHLFSHAILSFYDSICEDHLDDSFSNEDAMEERLCYTVLNRKEKFFKYLQLMEKLLALGSDPNERFIDPIYDYCRDNSDSSITNWKYHVHCIQSINHADVETHELEDISAGVIALTKALIENGADCNAYLDYIIENRRKALLQYSRNIQEESNFVLLISVPVSREFEKFCLESNVTSELSRTILRSDLPVKVRKIAKKFHDKWRELQCFTSEQEERLITIKESCTSSSELLVPGNSSIHYEFDDSWEMLKDAIGEILVANIQYVTEVESLDKNISSAT